MEIKEKREGSTLVLRLAGDFPDAAPALQDALTRAMRGDGADVIVDLSAVGDFRALKLLVAAERLRRDEGGLRRLAIVAPPDSDVATSLMLSGMRRMIPVYASLDDLHGAWETDGFPA